MIDQSTQEVARGSIQCYSDRCIVYIEGSNWYSWSTSKYLISFCLVFIFLCNTNGEINNKAVIGIRGGNHGRAASKELTDLEIFEITWNDSCR